MNLTLNEILILLVIGVFAGMISGFIGVGGGIVIVPALVLDEFVVHDDNKGNTTSAMKNPFRTIPRPNF